MMATPQSHKPQEQQLETTLAASSSSLPSSTSDNDNSDFNMIRSTRKSPSKKLPRGFVPNFYNGLTNDGRRNNNNNNHHHFKRIYHGNNYTTHENHDDNSNKRQEGRCQAQGESNDETNKSKRNPQLISPQQKSVLDTKKGEFTEDIHDIHDHGDNENDTNFNLSLASAPAMEALTDAVLNLSLEDNDNNGNPSAKETILKPDKLQSKALELATVSLQNIFLTGRAGTGKSWITKQIVKQLQQNQQRSVHVTAPTGMAAIHIHGTTIHRWGGFGLGEYYSDFDRCMSPINKERIRKTDTLVLDEISMISGHLFDVLECIVSIVRYYNDIKDRIHEIKLHAPATLSPEQGGHEDETYHKAVMVSQDDDHEQGHHRRDDGSISGKATMSPYMLQMRWKSPDEGGLGDIPPWGGMQLILVGDFFQLPPIPNRIGKGGSGGGGGGADNDVLLGKRGNEELMETEYNLKVGQQGCYAFQSHAWNHSNLHSVELIQVHRQQQQDGEDSNDGLLDLLNAMREGEPNLANKHWKAVTSLKSPLPLREDGIKPTELFSKNKNVDEKNRAELAKLPCKTKYFKSKDEVELCDRYKDRLLKKYRLKDIRHMPYLWSCVQSTPSYPSEWIESTEKVKTLEETKSKLLKEERYEDLGMIRDQINKLKQDIIEIEEDYVKKSTITAESIEKWIDQNTMTIDSINEMLALSQGDSQTQLSPTNISQVTQRKKPKSILSMSCHEIFKQVEKFQKQLKEDHDALSNHASSNFFQRDCRVGAEIELKVDAQVMLLWNIDLAQKLVNGSRGIVLAFFPAKKYQSLIQDELTKRMKEQEKLKMKKEKEGASKEETKDKEVNTQKVVELDGSKPFDHEIEGIVMDESATSGIDNADSKGTTSPSKATMTESPIPESTEKERIPKSETDAVDYITNQILPHMSTGELNKELQNMQSTQNQVAEYPLIKFDWTTRLIVPRPFQKEFKGCGIAKRWQLPLAHAWAISIHKSQGMTIDWLRVNLEGCFSPGQAYVACSRGRSITSMQVDNFCQDEIKTSQIAKRFYQRLSSSSSSNNNSNGSSDIPIWSDSLANFENTREAKKRLQQAMKRAYGQRTCTMCGSLCQVRQVQNNKNGNRGKWYVACNEDYRNGHTFDWVSVIKM